MLKILIVEDCPEGREIVADVFSYYGYEVIEAVNGLEGVRLALETNPDAIVMDLSIPELNGWEATERIRSDPRGKHIPIIAVTAYTGCHHKRQAFEAGVDRYLSKPFDPGELVAVVRQLLSDAERGKAEGRSSTPASAR